MLGVGNGFVDALHVGPVEDHAGGTGVDQLPDAGRAAGIQDVLGPDDVSLAVFLVFSPDAGLGPSVHDGCTAFRGVRHGVGVGQVAAPGLDPGPPQFRVVSPGEAPDLVSAL